MSLGGWHTESGGGESPPETPMLVEMGKSGTPALLLCELLLPALAQRLDLLSPMRARVGRIMLARKKKTPPPTMSTKAETRRLILAGPFYFSFFPFPSFLFFWINHALMGEVQYWHYVDFFMPPPDPPARRNLPFLYKYRYYCFLFC